MGTDDLPLMHVWLGRPHIRRWWGPRGSYEKVVSDFLPAIEGADPTDPYVVLLEGQPIGFVQTYLLADYPDYAASVGADEGAAGVDLFVADEGLTGQGLGGEILRGFVAQVVFGRSATTHCTADPDVRNVASLRVFEKAGFRLVKTFFDAADRQTHALMRLDRVTSIRGTAACKVPTWET